MKVIGIIMLILSVVGGIGTATSDAIQAFWAAHPQVAPLVSQIFTTIALFMPALALRGKPNAVPKQVEGNKDVKL